MALPIPFSSPCARRCRDGPRLGLWANQQGGWVVRDLACTPSRPSITYCDHAPDPAGPPLFRPPARIALGAAASGTGMPEQAADAGLAWARYYAYALPEGDLAAEAAAGAEQLRSYFRVQLADGGAGDSSTGLRTVLVVPPQGGSSASNGSGGKSGSPGLPIPLLAAAAGGGAAVAAAAAALCCCWRRRRQRQRLEEAGRAQALAGLTAESGSSLESADCCKAASVTAL